MEIAGDAYLTLKGRTEGSFCDRKSRFTGIALPVYSETDVKNSLTDIKKEYYDAVHHCYAWILFDGNKNFRYNDDGEPSGSAGVQIYNQISVRNLANILVVVVRYFGGIKLGVPGLISAYRTATAVALDKAELSEKFLEKEISATFTYVILPEISKIEKKFNLIRISEIYNDTNCSIRWKARLSSANECIEKFSRFEGLIINSFKDES